MTDRAPSRCGAAWIPILLSFAATPLAAQKTDVLILGNGDHITGEIKKLDRGQLEYSTDDMGRLFIEWDEIARLTSINFFEIELDTGRKYFGNLPQAGEDQKLVVALDARSDTLELIHIVKITPIKARFWSRFDGNVDVGFSFAQANNVLQLSLGATVKYRVAHYFTTLTYSSYFQDQDELDSTDRVSVTLSFRRFMGRKWNALIFGKVEQNEELNLDLRTSLGGGPLWGAIQTNRKLLLAGAGLLVSREQFTGLDPRVNLEGLLALDFEAFRFDDPELDLSVTLTVYPGITDWGRLRLQLNATGRYELVSDFFLGLTLFESYDNGGTQAAAINDFAVTLSIGYSF